MPASSFPPSAARLQPGPSAQPDARSAHQSGEHRIEHRRENLINLTIGHWHVQGSAPAGYWQARCIELDEVTGEECGHVQAVRLDASMTYIPRCKCCSASRPKLRPSEARARAKYLTGKTR